MTEYDAEADERFMREAIAEGAIAGAAGDVPVGCVIVADGEIIARDGQLTGSRPGRLVRSGQPA